MTASSRFFIGFVLQYLENVPRCCAVASRLIQRLAVEVSLAKVSSDSKQTFKAVTTKEVFLMTADSEVSPVFKFTAQ